jgi:biotin carboxylase
MRKLLVLAPTSRELRDLPALANRAGIELIFDPFDDDYFDRLIIEGAAPIVGFDLHERIERTAVRARDAGIDGVCSAVGYPGMSAAAVIAQRLGLPGPDPRAVLLCEHKYYCREAQRRIVPEATPRYTLIDPARSNAVELPAPFPLFLKPVKSCMSMHAYMVKDRAEVDSRTAQGTLPSAFVDPFNALLRHHTNWPLDASGWLLEETLRGRQVLVEGYMQAGRARVIGIIDAVMFPGTYSFSRFQYPSTLDQRVQDAIESIAVRFIEGIDYGDALFNIEMIWDPETDRIGIIEVNPKIASQFPDLFEKVDGTSTYTTMMAVALGLPVRFERRHGAHPLAASCVFRTFTDQQVLRVPAPKDIEAVYRRFPDARVQIIAQPGKRLSQNFQDVASFRYALVNLGARSEAELLDNLSTCQRLLPFEMIPCASS